MSRQEICVQMREHHVGDAQIVLLREGKILLDVTLRIDDGSEPRLLVANEI
jgi:hypothetical protein